MDKQTLSNYGWIVVLVLILAVMMALATPFGSFVSTAIKDVTGGFYDVNGSALSVVGVDSLLPPPSQTTNYSAEEINNNPLLFGIGKTKSEYVVAKFNDDYSEVVITKNGDDSDGLMKDFSHPPSPMKQQGNTLIKAIIKEGVLNVGDYAFYECENLKSVIFPEGMTSIGKYAFYWCENLTSITIPDSVTSLGFDAFCCTRLVDIVIGSGITKLTDNTFGTSNTVERLTIKGKLTQFDTNTFTSYIGGSGNIDSLKNLKYLYLEDCTLINNFTHREGRSAFQDHENLETVIINSGSLNSVKFWNGDFHGVFEYCKSLKNVTLGNGVTHIGDYAFRGCENLTSITIPKSITNIGEGVFNCCRGLTSVTIPDSVISIGEAAFIRCENLTSITIPDSVTSIGRNAFCWCENLTSITIPDSVTSIDEYAFRGCKNLTSITIPNSITSISERTFGSCSNLKEVYIPSSVTSIGDIAFKNIASNSTIYCETQAVADLLVADTHYTLSKTTVVVDAGKF